MAYSSRIPPEEAFSTDEHVSGWASALLSAHGRWRGQAEECPASDEVLPAWTGRAPLPEAQREALNIRRHLGELIRARQDVDTHPGVWRRLHELSRRQDAQDRLLREQEQWLQQQSELLQQQQERLARLERLLDEPELEAPPAEPDEQQRWMMEHPEEVEKHRGQHVAIHATRGIVAAGDDYASLVEKLEQQAVPDDEVVIEFIRPSPFTK